MVKTRRPACDREGCQHLASVEWFIRWTDGHSTYNVWRSCRHHRPEMLAKLSSGEWSGGVVPAEMRETQPDWLYS